MANQKIGLEAILQTDQFQKGMKVYTSGLDRMQKETSGFDGKLAAFGKKGAESFQNLGKVALGAGVAIGAAGAAAGVAIGKFVADGIGKAADLESQLSSIAATLNMTKEQVGPLNDLILQLGLDPNLKVSATEAADAIENLAKNGLSMTQIIDGAARSTVLLANATGADFGMAADIASDTMSLFNIKAEDMAGAVDQITGVTNASKFTIDDYRLAIAQAGGVAALVGMEFQDFNTTIAAISPLFASGSDAGTSLKTMLMRLIPTTTAAEEVFSELELVTFNSEKAMELLSRNGIKPLTNDYGGIHRALQQYFEDTYKVSLTTQEGIDKFGKWTMEIGLMQNAFFDTNGQMKGMADVSEILNEATKDLTEEQRIMAFETMFGSDAIRAASGVAGAGAVMYETAAEAAKVLGVSIEDAAAVAEGGITKFEAMQLQIAKIDASEQAATRMDNFKGSLEILQGAIETLQIQIGQVFLPVLSMLAKKATELVSAYGPAITEAFSNFGATLSRLFEVVPAVVAAFNNYLETGNELIKGTSNVKGEMASLTSQVLQVVIDVYQLKEAIFSVISPITDAIGSFVEWKDVLIVLAGAVAFVVVPAIYGMMAAMAPITLFIGGAILAVAALRTAWENDWLGIQTKTTEAISAIQIAFAPLTEAIKTNGAGALLEIKAFATGNATEWTNVKAVWEGAKTTASGLFTSIVSSATTNLPLWTAELLKWSDSSWLWITETAIPSVTAELGAWVTTVTNFVKDNLPQWQAKLKNWGDAAWQWITETAIPFVATHLGTWVTTVTNFVKDNLPQWIAKLKEWGEEAWKWVTDTAIPFVTTELGTWVKTVTNIVKDNLPQWVAKLKDWASGAWQWIVDAVPLAVTELGKWVTTVTNFVKDNLPAWREQLGEWALAASRWVAVATILLPALLAEWFAVLKNWFDSNKPAFEKKANEWSFLLYSWISSEPTKTGTEKALDDWKSKGFFEKLALFDQELNTHFIDTQVLMYGWIGDAIAGTIIAVTDWLIALFQAADPNAPAVSPEKDKAKTRIQEAVTNMMIEITAALGASAFNLGKAIWDGLTQGWEESPIGEWVKGAVKTLVNFFLTHLGIASPSTVFFDIGADIIRGARDGIESMIGTLVSKVLSVVNAIVDGFKKAVDRVKEIGKNIIQGLIDGIAAMRQALIDKITEMAGLIPQWMKDILGIGSPSKVMIEVGYDIVRGLIKGIDEQQNRLRSAIGRMTNNVMQTLIQTGARATDVFAGLAGGFSSLGGGWADSLKATIDDFTARIVDMSTWTKLPIADLRKYANERTRLGFSVSGYENQKRTLDALKQQADLIHLIRESGGNPSEVLAGVKFGVDADPQQLLEIVTRTMSVLNARLKASVIAAASGFPEYVEKLRDSRKSVEDIEAQFIATHLDQRAFYAKNLAKVDTQIAQLEADLLATGNASIKPFIAALDVDRQKITLALQTYLEQTKKLQEVFSNIRNLTGPGQASASKFVADQIQPILDAFSGPMQAQERDAWLRTVADRVAMVNRFVDQMRTVELLQRRIEGNKAFDDLADEFAAITDILTPESQRTTMIDTLTHYIANVEGMLASLERLAKIQKDLTVGLSASPFVERFKSDRLDTIAKQLENINLSEAQRAQLIEQYRMEQEKILAIQQKQSQLDFLKQQLDLLNQVKDLDDKFGELVPVSDIFAGVQFGVNASLDSLLGAVTKAIDAMIRVTNHELGISSPSKVFEKIGRYMMGGLARGIETSVMRPINSLSGAISELPYALGGRSLNLNMGGVSISNGMDEVMFEARVRQILDRAFP